MNRNRSQGVWNQFSGVLRQRWGALFGAAGRQARSEGRIQERWAASNRAADRQLEEFMHRNRNWRDLSRS